MLITLQSKYNLPVSFNINNITGITIDRDDDGTPNKDLCDIHVDFMDWDNVLVVKGSVEEITKLINNHYQDEKR